MYDLQYDLNMRTTIVIDDQISLKLKPIISKRRLSEFINQCLREHFEKDEKIKKLKQLEEAYQRASSENSPNEDTLQIEDWPEW